MRSPAAAPRLNITFVGDSLSIQHFTSLACMSWLVCRAHASYTRSVNGVHQQCHAVCGSHLCMQHAGTRHAGQRSTAHYLQLFSNLSDVQVYNEGLWWNDHEIAMHKIHDFMRVFESLPSLSKSRVIWRETSPQHFESGRWSQWYRHTPCTPLLSPSNPWASARALGERYGCRVMPVWDLSAGFWTEHLAKKTNHTRARGYDCTHFCEPGVVDLWSLRLVDMLRSMSASRRK